MLVTNNKENVRYLFYTVYGETQSIEFGPLESIEVSDLTSNTQIIYNALDYKLLGINERFGTDLQVDFTFTSNSRPSLEPYGTIIDEDYSVVPNLSGYTVTNPASTWAITGGKIHTESAVVGGYTEYITFDTYGPTQLDRWEQKVYFKHTFDGTSIGISLGTKSTHGFGDETVGAFLALYGGGVGTINFIKNNISRTSSAANWIGASSSDDWCVTLSRDFGALPTYTATVENITLGLTNSTTYSLIDMLSTTYLTNTVSKFSIYNQGGKFDISAFNVTSAANKNVDICFLGYSIDEGYSSGGYANAWPAQAMIGNAKSYTKLCSQGAYSGLFLSCMSEIIACNATTYVIGGCLGNDHVWGVPDATADANYALIKSQIAAGVPGCNFIHIQESPRNGFDMNLINARRITLAGSDPIVDLFTPLLGSGYSLNAAYDTDGTHVNQTGQALMGTIINPYLV